MPAAWTCLAEPERHGSFLQSGLKVLSEVCAVVQPANRFACPLCLATGKSGWARPANEPEVARLAAEQGA